MKITKFHTKNWGPLKNLKISNPMSKFTSKDFNPSIKSETIRMKTEIKAEVKAEAFEEFDANEKIRMAFITSKNFDDKTKAKTEVKTEVKPEVKTEVKEENFEDFEMCEQAVIDLITSKDY